MYRQVFCISLIVLIFTASATASSLCTGYPKTYNGKPCASTTRYWDGQMGACGCGTGNTSPFSWQWNKPTAAASAPIFGSGTWCGSGCGKCFKLTPTGAGASVAGRGATNTNSLVVKVTNLCPYAGNEQWCAMDVNQYDYDAHFDLMDYNMNGIITAQGWDNPEVTYEEVDCASNGYADWNCQCASAPSKGATSAPTQAATPTTTAKPSTSTKATTKATTAAPTTKAAASTQAPAPSTSSPTTKANNSPAGTTSVTISPKSGSNPYWLGFSLSSTTSFSKVEVMDSGSAFSSWYSMSYHGDQYWGMYFVNPPSQMTLPISLRFTDANGKVSTANNVITSWAPNDIAISL